ncbi:TetR/AcrR family transcriptional regulator [Streptomyces sp. 150FB]|uniref:TetR/AcrR family transcriptional regulator n=1 Tax=Streptomyces sp. 150FB TaxID=1576605 RepID=UPI000695D5D0|nr:TetR/AcrR family transcriptional regulator [Streptomyces sp. 150FB]
MNARPYRSSVREQAAALTRTTVLDAAENLFAEHGYARITVARVAEVADVAANTVYAVFGSKPALVAALMERGAAEPAVARTLLAMNEVTDPAEIVRLAAAGTGETVRRHVRAMGVLYDNETADPVIADAARRADTLQRDRLGQVAGRLLQLGALRDGIGLTEATDVLWYYLSQFSWRRLRRMGWEWKRCEDWLADQVVMTLLAPGPGGTSGGTSGTSGTSGDTPGGRN